MAARVERPDGRAHPDRGGALPHPRASLDRGTLLTGSALPLVAAAAWASLLRQNASPGEAEMPMGRPAGLDPIAAAGFVIAWLVMMAAMMLPSALPMVLLHHRVADSSHRTLQTLLFVAGYLVTWGAFGLVVYLAQAGITLASAASPALAGLLPFGTAAVLVLGGLYQLTPLKAACLRQCRSPLDFLLQRWHGGRSAALRLGVDHGLYCVGCCWGLMAVLVAAGAMGLAWVTLIALVVFVEKLLPWGEGAARLVGLLLLGLGLVVALQPATAPLLQSSMLEGG